MWNARLQATRTLVQLCAIAAVTAAEMRRARLNDAIRPANHLLSCTIVSSLKLTPYLKASVADKRAKMCLFREFCAQREFFPGESIKAPSLFLLHKTEGGALCRHYTSPNCLFSRNNVKIPFSCAKFTSMTQGSSSLNLTSGKTLSLTSVKTSLSLTSAEIILIVHSGRIQTGCAFCAPFRCCTFDTLRS